MFSFARLFPREEKFYRFIETLSAEARQCAQHLKVYTESKDPGTRKKAAEALLASRKKAKAELSNVTRELCLTFITPFDREDIQNLSSILYKISKTIEKVYEFLELHQVVDVQELAPQVDLIIQEADAMEIVIQGLITGKKPEEIIKKAEILDELENKGDEILSKLLVNLIQNTQDARQLILRKDIYNLLERAIDRYRDAAGVALQIALKHS